MQDFLFCFVLLQNLIWGYASLATHAFKTENVIITQAVDAQMVGLALSVGCKKFFQPISKCCLTPSNGTEKLRNLIHLENRFLWISSHNFSHGVLRAIVNSEINIQVKSLSLCIRILCLFCQCSPLLSIIYIRLSNRFIWIIKKNHYKITFRLRIWHQKVVRFILEYNN